MIDDIYEHNGYEDNDNLHYHNETIVINNGVNQFIFNFLALSLNDFFKKSCAPLPALL